MESPKVKYVSLDEQWAQERPELLDRIDKVLASGNYVGGEVVEEFEEKVARACGTKHAVALNSGTDALVCSMHALGIGRGDEVITVPNSFVASTATIVHVGATPVFVDVLEDQSMDVNKIEEVITSKTKAILPVHLTGRMTNMAEITRIAKKHNLMVVEDCAQSIGSKFDGKLSGAWGDVGCFSAHPLKNLNACGDGGFVTTNDNNLAEKIKLMRSHGLQDRNTVLSFGYVSRLDVIQAAILIYRLEKLEDVIRRRRENAADYINILKPKHIFWPAQNKRYFDTFHTFVIQVDRREELITYLGQKGVQTAIHYPVPIHLQPAAKNLGYSRGDFPITEKQSERILTLPINQFLKTAQISYISEQINSFFEKF